MDAAGHSLENILRRIAEASKASLLGNKTKLLAVSKTYQAEAIEPFIMAGQMSFGENRVQEAMQKWSAIKARHTGIKLHLIGSLQSNKAREAAQFFDVIESVDRPKLVEALAAIWPNLKKKPALYMQINTGSEPQKAGVMPENARDLLEMMRQSGLPVDGVMCIPPASQPSEPHFAWLYNFARKNGISEISMGMSHDFEAAVRFGATQVRVGSALFGARS